MSAPSEGHALGALLAAGASLFWTLAPFFFASAVRRLGAPVVNPLRLGIAAAIQFAVGAAYAAFNPAAARALTPASVLWLAASGALGLVVGDAFYLRSLGMLGARRTLQILILAPLVSASVAWIWLGEAMTARGIAGMALTLGALTGATALERGDGDTREPGRLTGAGVGVALLAMLFHGLGAVLARQAFRANAALDPALATAVRVFSAAVCIWTLVAIRGRGRHTLAGLRDRHAMGRLLFATLLGPVLGMFCYVAAFKSAPAGIVSLLSSLSPVLIVPIAAWRYHTRLRVDAWLCVILAIVGVALVSLP